MRRRWYPPEDTPSERLTREILQVASPSKTILDIGCGRRASFLRSVSNAFGTCCGVDPEVHDTSKDGLELLRGSATELPLGDSSVDVVTMINSIEHLDRPADAIRECRRVLRTGGSLFVLAPNKWFGPILLGRLFPHGARVRLNYLLNHRKTEDTFPAYYRANTVPELKRLALACGLVPATLAYFSADPAYFVFSPLLYRCWAALERTWLRRDAFAGLSTAALDSLKMER